MEFTHAVMDDGDMIRKYRWSNKEAKWYQDTHKDIQVIRLFNFLGKELNKNFREANIL